MIQITFDIVTGLAKLASSATVIVLTADVPVQILFSAAPGSVSGLYLILGSDASAPLTLAYTEAFEEENATTYNALLDCTDTRLATFMAGKGPTAVNCQIGAIIDGAAQISPDISITVRPNIKSGPTTSDGGPTYYTQPEVDAAIAAALAGLLPAGPQTNLTPGAAVATALFAATLFSRLFRKIIPTAGSGVFTAAYTLSDASQSTDAVVKVNVELPASGNPTVTLSDNAGTLLATVTNLAPATTAFWFGEFHFDGSAWHLLFQVYTQS
jgi:hypothetical protein